MFRVLKHIKVNLSHKTFRISKWIYSCKPLNRLSLKISIEQAGKGLKGQDWVLRERQKGQEPVRDGLRPRACLKEPGEVAGGEAGGTASFPWRREPEGILQPSKGACTEHLLGVECGLWKLMKAETISLHVGPRISRGTGWRGDEPFSRSVEGTSRHSCSRGDNTRTLGRTLAL